MQNNGVDRTKTSKSKKGLVYSWLNPGATEGPKQCLVSIAVVGDCMASKRGSSPIRKAGQSTEADVVIRT